MFQVAQAGMWLCPTCQGQNLIGCQAEKDKNLTTIIILCICGAFLLIALIAGAVDSALSDETEGELNYSADSYGEYGRTLDLKSEIARDYIMNDLPAGQRDAILSGRGSSEDQANAMANLMKSGNIEGAAKYLQDY